MAARKRKGQTLVEVVVATMVAATVATAIFSVVLSSQVSTVRSDKREAAAMVIKAAQEQLKVYVSATPTDGNFVACSASPCTAAN
ncbi:MAG TPA: prepilin-type N-terminal cleavage/methylation domain-containing protein, partial [Elusimicrobiales bacterium]|nr:prepilin-type N-terminal cleavage/methylation domain-containing protein [Elusimicrobiales bacterium]